MRTWIAAAMVCALLGGAEGLTKKERRQRCVALKRQCMQTPLVDPTTTTTTTAPVTTVVVSTTTTTTTTIVPRMVQGLLIDRIGATTYDRATVRLTVTADARLTFTLNAEPPGFQHCWPGGGIHFLQGDRQFGAGGFNGIGVRIDAGPACADLNAGVSIAGEFTNVRDYLDLTAPFTLYLEACDATFGGVCQLVVP